MPIGKKEEPLRDRGPVVIEEAWATGVIRRGREKSARVGEENIVLANEGNMR